VNIKNRGDYKREGLNRVHFLIVYMRKVLKIVYYAIVALLIAVSLLLVASIFPVANLRIKSVLSGSMEPAIDVGSVIVITRPADEYKIDDIITFQFALNHPTTTHRIIDTKIIEGTTYFIT